MIIDLDRDDFITLIRSNPPCSVVFNNELVKKAGFSCRKTNLFVSWDNIDNLTDDELISLYKICKESWWL